MAIPGFPFNKNINLSFSVNYFLDILYIKSNIIQHTANINAKGFASAVQQRKYEILLLSFMLLIFGNTFIYHIKIFDIFNLYQNMLTGLVIFYNRRFVRMVILILLLFSLSLDVYENLDPLFKGRTLHSINYLIFFFIVSIEVYKAVLYARTVTRELLSAALCGFVLLCLICTFLFFELESSQPNSFSNLGSDHLTNLNYCSFITLLTIGYGDIVPLTLIAKRAVMFMGLLGHFYTVFVTSIIIGKYLSAKQS